MEEELGREEGGKEIMVGVRPVGGGGSPSNLERSVTNCFFTKTKPNNYLLKGSITWLFN